MIQLPDAAATHIKWQLENYASDIERLAKIARSKAASNVVAKPGEQYLAAALERARAELVKAYKGINQQEIIHDKR